MKILWVSPYGDGWAMAHKLRQAGNKVVLLGPSPNGLGFLPAASLNSAEELVPKADLVILDHCFPSRATRRSWEPSDEILRLNAIVKKHGVAYVGPTPTAELLENDTRYQAKILRRVGLGDRAADNELLGGDKIDVTVSIDPEANASLVLRFRERETWACDLVVPLVGAEPLVSLVKPLLRFTKSIGYNGYVNLDLSLHETGPKIKNIRTSFLYPAIFAQFGSLLRSDTGQVGVAVTAFVSDEDVFQARHTSADRIAERPGFFPFEIARNPEDQVLLNGNIAGAIVVLDSDIARLKDETEDQLTEMSSSGLRGTLDDRLFTNLLTIHEWGYLSN